MNGDFGGGGWEREGGRVGEGGRQEETLDPLNSRLP
jgi:hypothetical protein